MTRVFSHAVLRVFPLICLLLLMRTPADAAVLGRSDHLLRGCDQYGNTNTETSFGSFTADAVRTWSGAEIALLPSADFGTNLQAGPVTDEALAACLQKNSELAVVSMTAPQLYTMLETGVSHLVLKPDSVIDWEQSSFGGYLQLSGLSVIYDAAAPAGQRVYALALDDGTPIDPTDSHSRFRVASTIELLQGGYGYPAFPLSSLEPAGTERDAVSAYFRLGNTGSIPGPDRVKLYGTRNWTIDHRASILLVLTSVCLVVAQISKRSRHSDVWRSSRTAAAQDLSNLPPQRPERHFPRKEGRRCSNIS